MKLKFEPNIDGTKMFVRNNKNEPLGEIYYMLSWKCYVWEQHQDIIMSDSCLLQIHKQLKMADERMKKKNEMLKKVRK